MDVVRAVLEEERIDYLGASYGTYLGAVYGTLFLERLDRAVLDSAVDPNRIWRENFLAPSRAATDNVERCADWLAGRDGQFGLGATREEVIHSFEQISERLRKEPREAENGMTYDENHFWNLVGISADAQGGWDDWMASTTWLGRSCVRPTGPRTRDRYRADMRELRGAHAFGPTASLPPVLALLVLVSEFYPLMSHLALTQREPANAEATPD